MPIMEWHTSYAVDADGDTRWSQEYVGEVELQQAIVNWFDRHPHHQDWLVVMDDDGKALGEGIAASGACLAVFVRKRDSVLLPPPREWPAEWLVTEEYAD